MKRKRRRIIPLIEVHPYKWNRNIGNTYLLYVLHIPTKRWYTVSVEANTETVFTKVVETEKPPKTYL